MAERTILELGGILREFGIKVQEDVDAVVRQSVTDLVNKVDDNLEERVYSLPTTPHYPKRTGYLRAYVVLHDIGTSVPGAFRRA